MPRQKFEDVAGGDTLLVDVVDEENGYRQCTFSFTFEQHQESFNNIPNIKCHDDDIILNSYPKTGTHWLWEMLQMVIKQTAEVSNANKLREMIEAFPTEVVENLPSPRVLNTHLKIKYLPKDIIKKRLKMFLLLRNPKDVAVSLYHHLKGIKFYEYDGKFENFLRLFQSGGVDYGSYPEYLREWQTFIKENPDFPVHVVYYEDLIADCFGEMKKVCEFLGKEVSSDLLRQIVESCQIDKMRQVKDEKMTDEMRQVQKTALNADFNMFRKGGIGNWKNRLTVAQNEYIDKWWDEETKDLDMFSFKFV
ncbi:sulfotransferase 1A2-like [Ruditapes philippinarum]|uniref:sulfotransferase 1A2-like n=1 Tax=Ruditapes philippinarum TaxID=129788 RepID=UPI00295B8A92|nr:sulfotransferase 1A2-like [Ruditapes philippinarum]